MRMRYFYTVEYTVEQGILLKYMQTNQHNHVF